jgi:4'-phosphopantetheinyl transferase
MVHVLYSKIPAVFPDHVYRCMFSRLPLFLQNKNARYRQWQDKLLNLFGILLLAKGLAKLGYAHISLQQIQYSMSGRPFIADQSGDKFDFNISHSNEYVVCAISDAHKVGIDIEAIKPVEFNDFRDVMSDDEWRYIETSDNPLQTFFDFWTIKESVIKADGRGMSINLTTMEVFDYEVVLEDTIWHLNELNIDDSYAMHLATDWADACVDMEYIEYYNL